MRQIIYFLFERIPLLETLFRCTVDRFPALKKIAKNAYKKKPKPKIKNGQWECFKNGINSIGIQKGDIVLIHSSMIDLATMGVSEKTIIDFFIDLVGSTGTIVFPTFPFYSIMKKNGKQYDGISYYYYDPKKTKPWTGLLPAIFLTYPNVKRSLFPHNTLAALGADADEMMKDTLKSVYSQDQYSPWQYLIDHNAKILYLGLKKHEGCTIVHYPEDFLGEQYPVKDFFVKEDYVIKTPDGEIVKEIRTRDEKWYKYYKMFYIGYWMKKNGYLKEMDFDGIHVGYSDNIKEMTDDLVLLAKKGKLLFNIPFKYRKKNETNNG